MRKIFLLLAIYLFTLDTYSQTTKSNENSNTQPFDLPNAIIYGKEFVNVKSGIKAIPDKSKPLSKEELDSLNNLEKQAPALLPKEEIKETIEVYKTHDTYFGLQYGRFNTFVADGAGAFQLNGYDIFIKGDVETSTGHIDNAEFLKLNINAFSDYIAPEKFWIFGGSKTRSKIEVKSNNYNLFASPTAESRASANLNLSADTEGYYNGFLFNTGLAIKSMSVGGDVGSASEIGFGSYINFTSALSTNFDYGLDIDADLRSVSGEFMPYIHLAALLNYKSGDFTAKLKTGFQTASSINNETQNGLLFDLNLKLPINYDFGITANLFSGVRKTYLSDFLAQNPYMAFNSAVVMPRDLFALKSSVYYNPNMDLGAVMTMAFRNVSNFSQFSLDSAFLFNQSFQNGYIAEIETEAFWEFIEQNKLSFNAKYTISQDNQTENQLLYLPDYIVGLNYLRNWSINVATDLGIIFVGNQLVGNLANNERFINSYANLYLKTNIKISDTILLNLKLNNLLNQDIFIWEGYRERNLFAIAGLTWLF